MILFSLGGAAVTLAVAVWASFRHLRMQDYDRGLDDGVRIAKALSSLSEDDVREIVAEAREVKAPALRPGRRGPR